MTKKLLYVKENPVRPGAVGKVVECFDSDYEFTDRELASEDVVVKFGHITLDITADEVVLCSCGRRKVDDVDNPTAIISVD